MPGFLGWLTSALRGEDRSGGDAVEIVTFHAAKGLEWSVVHLAGLEEGFVPIHHAKDSDDDLEEERRLLYVALTRARDELHCTWAASRTFGSRTAKRSPSPWLPDHPVDGGHRADPARPSHRCRPRPCGRARRCRARGARTCPTATASCSRRSAHGGGRQAKEADVAAFVIFNDATLIAVAAARPRNRAELLRVSGVGPVKAQRFGDDLLRIVAEHR